MITCFCKWLVIVFGVVLSALLLWKELSFVSKMKKAEEKSKRLQRPTAWDCVPGQLIEGATMRAGFDDGTRTSKPIIEPKDQIPIKPKFPPPRLIREDFL